MLEAGSGFEPQLHDSSAISSSSLTAGFYTLLFLFLSNDRLDPSLSTIYI